MNEEANKQLVRRAYQSIQEGDVQSLLNVLAADVVWQLPDMAHVPFAGTWRGREQVGQFFRVLAEVQDVVEFEPEEFIAQAGKVIVFGRFTMRVKATRKHSRSEWVHVWTFEAGKVSHMREYVDTLAVSRAYTVAQLTKAV